MERFQGGYIQVETYFVNGNMNEGPTSDTVNIGPCGRAAMYALSQAIVKVVTCESTTQVWCLETMLHSLSARCIYLSRCYLHIRLCGGQTRLCMCVFHLDI